MDPVKGIHAARTMSGRDPERLRLLLASLKFVRCGIHHRKQADFESSHRRCDAAWKLLPEFRNSNSQKDRVAFDQQSRFRAVTSQDSGIAGCFIAASPHVCGSGCRLMIETAP